MIVPFCHRECRRARRRRSVETRSRPTCRARRQSLCGDSSASGCCRFWHRGTPGLRRIPGHRAGHRGQSAWSGPRGRAYVMFSGRPFPVAASRLRDHRYRGSAAPHFDLRIPVGDQVDVVADDRGGRVAAAESLTCQLSAGPLWATRPAGISPTRNAVGCGAAHCGQSAACTAGNEEPRPLAAARIAATFMEHLK